ncbi:MAG TPA: tetratricopeptide repeat protein [Vicinamibacterales bacterium]|nr:tetratricopeptide repeat protein [Vicinamibacterales bacterium]
MSQILDSLRRSRKSDTQPASSRTARGDAVLATLGYAAPARGRRHLPIILTGVVLVALAAIGWMVWKMYFAADAGPVPAQRVMSPGMPRPPAPLPKPAPPDPALIEADHRGTVDAPPVAESTSAVSNVGRRRSAGPRITDPGSRPSTGSGRPELVEGPPTTAPDATTSPPARENDLELALYYHRAGDFENALQHYRALLARNELNAQAHNNLGLLYQERNLLRESARELQRAVVIEPRNAGTRNNYGVTLLMLGQVDQAAAEFQTAVWLDPRNLDALVNLSLVQRKAGQLDIAKETLLRVLNIAPRNAAAHYNLAQLYDDTNERARAAEHYRQFLENAGAEHADRAAAVRARIAALNTMSK